MSISELDPRALRILRTILQERNITHAANRLGMAQPVASAALAKMRKVLQDPLLVRGSRSMVLTERAQAVLPVIVRIMDDLEQLAEPATAFDPASAQLDFSLAAADYVQTSILPPMLGKLSLQAPMVRVSLKPMEPHSLANNLEQSNLDMAIMPIGNAPDQLISKKICEERFLCVSRIGHPRIGKRLDLDTYCQLSHILVSQTNHDFRGQVDKALAAVERSRHVRIAVPNFFAAIELVRQSDDVATVPERLARRFKSELAIHEPPLSVPGFTLALVWHQRSQTSLAHNWLRNLIVSSAKSETAGAPQP